jgi:hypothetical protein
VNRDFQGQIAIRFRVAVWSDLVINLRLAAREAVILRIDPLLWNSSQVRSYRKPKNVPSTLGSSTVIAWPYASGRNLALKRTNLGIIIRGSLRFFFVSNGIVCLRRFPTLYSQCRISAKCIPTLPSREDIVREARDLLRDSFRIRIKLLCCIVVVLKT